MPGKNLQAVTDARQLEETTGTRMKRIYVVGTADTKGEELAFLADAVATAGSAFARVDIGTHEIQEATTQVKAVIPPAPANQASATAAPISAGGSR